ncbi:MAG: YggT family protein [Polyangiales bacterium]
MPIFRNLLNALRLLILADAVLSFGMSPSQFPRSFTKPLLDPVYAPVRRVLSPLTGSIDLSPLIALAALYALQYAVERALSSDGS